MAGDRELPDYAPIEHNGNRARNAIHRAETFALRAEHAASYEGDVSSAQANASISAAWAQIALAVQQGFGGAS